VFLAFVAIILLKMQNFSGLHYCKEDFLRYSLLPRRSAVAKEGHPCLGGPLPLQNVKEQARERHTASILPRFCGNAKYIFFLNPPKSARNREGHCKGLLARGFRSTTKDGPGKMAREGRQADGFRPGYFRKHGR
jgi:hypothetical protein